MTHFLVKLVISANFEPLVFEKKSILLNKTLSFEYVYWVHIEKNHQNWLKNFAV